MKIVSYNVAGLRSMLRKPEFHEFIFADGQQIDILCLQETKAEEHQVKLDCEIIEKYPYRFWNSTKGTTQRKGLSGVSIWSMAPPLNDLKYPDWDDEGRIATLEYENFILVNVYVPNSQKLDGERYHFRSKWNMKFMLYINELKLKFTNKEIIICGDMNVAHLDIDICNPSQKKNKVPGFFDTERSDFAYLLEMYDLKDIFRELYPNRQKSTYWSNFLKAPRKKHNGWGIDYFICSSNFMESTNIDTCNILMEIKGSDHCPLELVFNI